MGVSGESANKRALGYTACAAAACLWSTGFYFGKIALAAMGVGHMVLYRFLFACLGLLPILLQRRFRQAQGLNRREWRALLLASFLGVPGQFLLQFRGLSMTSVSHAALMVGTLPVIVAVGATIFTHERLDRVGWLALCGSTAGVALIAFSGTAARTPSHSANSPSLSGDLLVVISMFISLG